MSTVCVFATAFILYPEQTCPLPTLTSDKRRKDLPKQVFLEAPPRFGLGVKLLQSSALPLGYGANCLTIVTEQIKKINGFTATFYIFVLSDMFSDNAIFLTFASIIFYVYHCKKVQKGVSYI